MFLFNEIPIRRVLAKCGCIDIKQKAGCLSHLDDTDGLKSLLAQTLTTEKYSCWKIEVNMRSHAIGCVCFNHFLLFFKL